MKKKKWKDIRSAVTMMCVMLAMISTATYAWFTLAESATVTGLQMTAVTNGGLMVSTDRTNWSNAVELRSIDSEGKYESPNILTPVSVVTRDLISLGTGTGQFWAPKLQMPEYNDNEVIALYDVTGTDTDTDNINYLTIDNLSSKAVKKTFYIKDGAGAAAQIGIKIANANTIIEAMTANSPTKVGLSNGKSNLAGSFVVLNEGEYADTNNAYDDALEAVRIGLVVYSNTEETATLKIWEPNADMTKLGTATYATNSVETPAVTADVISKYNGTITTGMLSGTTDTSEALIELTANDVDGVRVDVFMWFEGQDDSCVDQIMADTIIGQLEFVTVGTAPTD